MKPEDDDRWLSALAGRSQPDDKDTTQAGQLRNFFEKQREEEVQDLDEASYRWMMNSLQAKGAFRPAAQIPAAPERSGWLAWLFPAGGLSGRHAFVAMAVVAVVAAPLVLHQPEDDAEQVKRAPPSRPVGIGEYALTASDPAQRAREIESALIGSGVVPRVEIMADQVTVTANLRQADVGPAQTALRPYQVDVRSEGPLRLVIRRP